MVVLYISCVVDPQSNTPLTHIPLRRITRSGWTTGNAGGSICICCSRVSYPTSTGLRAWPRGARAGTTLTRLHTLCTGSGVPEYIPPEDDVFPAEEQPLSAAASPTTESPGYILESDLDEDPEEDDDEDPKEDPADYPADHDDDEEEEEEPSGDDAD
nr:hypothetical protein [Tanacetum cinerariifolium]